MKGIVMGAWRVMRCNPLNDGGFDQSRIAGLARKDHRRREPGLA